MAVGVHVTQVVSEGQKHVRKLLVKILLCERVNLVEEALCVDCVKLGLEPIVIENIAPKRFPYRLHCLAFYV